MVMHSLDLYRAGVEDRPFGQFFSYDPPVGVIQTRIDRAIPPVWPDGNPAPLATGFAIRFPQGTVVLEGAIANKGGLYVGGITQVVVPNAWSVPGAEVVDSWL